MTTLINTASWIGLPSFAGWLKKLNAKLAHRAAVNQTIRELSRLNDRELNDMGISRGDIYSIANGTSDLIRGVEANKNLKGWV